MAAGETRLGATAEQPPAPTRLFVAGAAWSLLGAAVARGLTLTAFVLAGRLLGSTGFGEVGMIQSTQGLFGVLAGGGLGLAATKFIAECRGRDWPRAGRCLTLALGIAVGAGLVGASALSVCAGPMARHVLHAPHLSGALRLGSGLLLFGAIAGVQNGALAGLGEFRTASLLGMLRGIVLGAALLVGIVLGGVKGAVAGLVFAEAVAVAANQYVLRRSFPLLWGHARAPGALRGELAALAHFSGLAIFASLATTLALWYGNVVLVNQPDGYAALGVFNAAERWRQLLLFLPAALAPVVLASLSHLHGSDDRAGFRRLLGLNLWVGVGTVAVPALALALAAPLAMSLFGDEYRDGSSTLMLLAGAAVASVANTLLGQVLVSRGRIGVRVALDLLLAGVLALSAWLAVPHLGAAGLALANLLAYGVAALALILPAARAARAAEPIPREAP